jgi:hypothetical protein
MVGRPEVRLPRPGQGLSTEPLAKYPRIGRRIAARRKAGTEVNYRKYKDIGHGFGLGTGTSADGLAVDATRFWENNK